MDRPRVRSKLWIWIARAVIALSLLAARTAHADAQTPEPPALGDVAVATDADVTTSDGGASPTQPAQPDKAAIAAANAHGLIVVPIPLIDPQLGNGVIPVGGFFYKPVAGGRPWVTGFAGLYTSRKDWALGIGQQADLFHGRLRITAGAGYGQFYLDFFGTGVAAGDAGRSIKLNQNGLGASFSALYDVLGKGHLYTGLRYVGVKLNTSVATKLFPGGGPTLPPFLPAVGLPRLPSISSLSVPPLVLRTADSMLGPAFEYDTKDSEFMPTKGTYVEGRWLFAEHAIGSTFEYNKALLAGNEYLPLSENTVLAIRAVLCHSSNGAPFYDLCLYGSDHDLRGYEGGQYRDHALGAAQIEIRQHLFWRFGVVAFGGIGGVAPSIGNLFDTKALPAGGVGLRFQPVKKIPVNLSMDYAWGSHSHALYLYLREAF
jgi:hypothetical protein